MSGLVIRGGVVMTIDDANSVVRADVRIAEGRIVAVGDVGVEEGDKVLDASGAVVLPGFVQTHIHLCQTLFRNLADDLALLEWLKERIWPLEAAHTYASLAASAELGIAEMLLGGTTAIVDMGTVHHTEAIFEALQSGGIRAVAGKCMMDDPSCPDGLREGTAESITESFPYRAAQGYELPEFAALFDAAESELHAYRDGRCSSAEAASRIFARIEPAQKLRLVEALQRGGHADGGHRLAFGIAHRHAHGQHAARGVVADDGPAALARGLRLPGRSRYMHWPHLSLCVWSAAACRGGRWT